MKILGKRHLVIPDTQAKPGVPLNHMLWLGDYIADKRPERVIHVGDHWDMPSLSSYDEGTKRAEGKRYAHDIAAGNMAMDLLMQPILLLNKQLSAQHKPLYKPSLDFMLGNHEQRIERHVNANANLAGTLGYHDFNLAKYGWRVHDFLDIVKIDGVAYSHYMQNPNSGRPEGGAAALRLKNVGFSFTQGHQQGKQQAERYLRDGTAQRALIVGSYYLHDEEYMGHQGNHYWRGVILKHEVIDGNYDLMEVSLNYLRKRFYEKYPKASRKAIVYAG
jgi:hypothetical protein